MRRPGEYINAQTDVTIYLYGPQLMIWSCLFSAGRGQMATGGADRRPLGVAEDDHLPPVQNKSKLSSGRAAAQDKRLPPLSSPHNTHTHTSAATPSLVPTLQFLHLTYGWQRSRLALSDSQKKKETFTAA